MASRDPFRLCNGVSRRDVLRIGTLSTLGIGVGSLAWPGGRVDAARSGSRRAQACILIWLDGGPSHLETFDPKPDAPQEVRGPFGTIETRIPGVHLVDLLPKLAERIDRVALIRSMTSPLGEHNLGTHYMMTGYRPTPVLEYPFYGSVHTWLKPSDSVIPPNVAVPDFRVGGGRFAGNGFLPAHTQPFSVGSDPGRPGFRVRDLSPYATLTARRLARRQEYLAALDRLSRRVEADPPAPADPEFEQAFRLVTSAEARRAFQLEDEPAETRQRYGSKTIGQACLLARRLVERGVPFVTVNQRGWDTHKDLYTRLKEGFTGAKIPVGLVPSLDSALSALLDDLTRTGLLDETLIVVMGEFGRTPKLNTSAGRDHWPRVFSVLLAGAGIPGGRVIGASDATGESPRERPVTPADLAATIYTLLGIDPHTKLTTPDGRPVEVVRDGEPVSELL